MSSSLAEFSVRVCEEADLPEICGDISEGVYFGHDYLRLLLPRWFRAQQTKVEVEGVQLSKYELFVIEHLPNRRVVAFEAIAFLDNFATVTFRGLRVHRDWNGRGLSKLLKHHLEARVASLPFVRRLRVTTGSYNTTSMKIHQDLSILTLLPIFGCDIARHHGGVLQLPLWADLARANAHLERRKLSAHELWALVDQHNVPFLHNPLHSMWVMYELGLDNLIMLEQEDGMEFYSTFSESGELASVAMGFECALSGGNTLQMTIYTHDASHFTAQLCAAIQSCNELMFTVSIMYDTVLKCHPAVLEIKERTKSFMSGFEHCDVVVYEEPIARIRDRVDAK
eukprot:m.398305 g.398305  ORF g.398305 m.398305 type:complete len:339 (+) comp56428_c0_seq2:4032-5048(+)